MASKRPRINRCRQGVKATGRKKSGVGSRKSEVGRGERGAERLRLGVLEEGVHEAVGVELLEVLELLAHAHELDGDVELVVDGDHYASLGGAVQLGEDDPADLDVVLERPGLVECVLTGGRVED